RSLEIEVRPSQTEDFADSQTEAQANQHDGSKRLNQRVENLPSILYLKDARTMPRHRRRIAPTIYPGSSPTPRTMPLKRSSLRNGSNMASTFKLTMHGS